MTATSEPVSYEEAVAGAGQVIADDLIRQSQRTPRDAALASLGRGATEQQITDWIRIHRPARARSA
jgi:hypothetical protein